MCMIKQILGVVLSCVIGSIAAWIFVARGGSINITSPLSSFESLHVQKPEVVGFLPYWLLSKADKKYEQFITTLTYFGLSLNADGSVMTQTNPQELEPGWNALGRADVADRLAEAEKKNMKTSLLVISGDDAIISRMLEDPIQSAQTMMRDIAPIMREKKFTDLNLDIETFMEASDSARAQFSLFVREVKKILTEQRLGTFTIDLIPIALVSSKLFDAKVLGELADGIVLMTYDYHYSGSLTSGSVAPIGGAGETIEFDVETAVKEALKVIPKEKILLGIPLYGYQWETLSQASESATIPGGSSTASVRRVRDALRDCADCVEGWDPHGKSPYLISKAGEYYTQTYYENEASMKEKIDLAKKYSLKGVALWALGYEDDTLLRPLAEYKSSFVLSW
jgi:spore germination protein YaaH